MDILKDNLDEIVMSIIFIAGDGISVKDIAEKLEITVDKINKSVERLKEMYSKDKGIHVITYRGKVQLSSNPEYADYIANVLNPIREKALTKAALETMAIIAYKQPITRLEIESIRGTSADYAVQVLLSHNLIEVVGRKDVVGKPLLFGTTDAFLKRFDLTDVNDLPNYDELMERIAVVNEGAKSDSMYNEYDIDEQEDEQTGRETKQQKPTQIEAEAGTLEDALDEELTDDEIFRDEIPDFLKDEKNVAKIS